LSTKQDCVGPMARTVKDAAIMYGVLANRDYTQNLNKDYLRGKTIGYLPDFFNIDRDITIIPDFNVITIFNRTVSEFTQAGAKVVYNYDLMKAFLAIVLNNSEKATQCSYGAFHYDIDSYLKKLPSFDTMRSLSDIYQSGQFLHSESLTTFLNLSKSALPDNYASNNCRLFLNNKQLLFELVSATLSNNHLDALLYPQSNQGPPFIMDNGAPFGSIMSVIISSATGLPSITVSTGSLPRSNVPVGLVMLAKDEDTLIKLAYSYEQQYPHRKSPSFLD